MRTKVTRVVGGKPQATFYQQQAAFQEEVREYLETTIPVYGTVEDEGTPLTQRTTLNFVGDGVVATDSGGKTVVTIEGKHGSRVLELPAVGAYGVRASNFFAEFTSLTNGSAAATASPVTASVSPPSGSVLYVGVTHDGTTTISSITGAGVAGGFTQVVTTGAVYKAQIWRGIPTSTGALTINFSGACSSTWSVFCVEGVATSGANAADSVVQTATGSTSVTISNSLFPNSPIVVLSGNNASAFVTVEAGPTQIHNTSIGTQNVKSAYASGPETFNYGGYNTVISLTNGASSVAMELRPHPRWYTSNALGGSAWLAIPLRVGDRITRVDVQGRHIGASGTFSALLWKVDKNNGTTTQVGSTATSASGSTADEEISISGLTETVAADDCYFVEWKATAAAIPQRFYGASITYDRL